MKYLLHKTNKQTEGGLLLMSERLDSNQRRPGARLVKATSFKPIRIDYGKSRNHIFLAPYFP
jgi:hypothetical protein